MVRRAESNEDSSVPAGRVGLHLTIGNSLRLLEQRGVIGKLFVLDVFVFVVPIVALPTQGNRRLASRAEHQRCVSVALRQSKLIGRLPIDLRACLFLGSGILKEAGFVSKFEAIQFG